MKKILTSNGKALADSTGKVLTFESDVTITRDNESIGLSGEYDGSPIEVTEAGKVDIKALIDEKKIPLEVNVSIEEKNTLKTLLDNTKSCYYLFSNYKGDNLSDLIQYNDTENVTSFDYMFQMSGATSFPLIDTRNGTSFSYMYKQTNAESYPLIDTSKGTNFDYMYQGCLNATSFPLIDTRNGTRFSTMFGNCYKAPIIPAIDLRNGTNLYNMFYYNSAPTSILMYGMKVNFDISPCKLLEAEALVTILSNCQVVTSTKTITMGSTLLAKLSGVYVKETGVEQYEGITCKPCVICESTDTGAMLATDYITGKGWTLV